MAQQHTPIDVSEVPRWDGSADVLIVGLGCAGAAAALQTAESGGSALVLEMLSGGGGSSAMSGGEIYLGGGTSVQRASGFESDTPEAMASYLGAALGPTTDPARIEKYAQGSLELFDWLVEHQVPFKHSFFDEPSWVPPTDDGLMWLGENAWPFTEIAAPAPRGHRVQSDGFGGKVLMQTLLERVAERPEIDVRTDVKAHRLILEGDRVVGVAATRFSEPCYFRATGGVVLTTGGFIDNPEMVELHAPQLEGLGTTSDGNDNGSGILIGQAAGAGVRHMSAGQVGMTVVPALMVRGLLVNRQGQRFINEDQYPGLVGQAALFAQDLEVFVIIDDQGYEEVTPQMRWGVTPHAVSDDLGELETECGFPPGSLTAAVEAYNRHAEHGEDPYFHKDARWLRPLEPPFGVIDVRHGMKSPEAAMNETSSDARSRSAGVFTTGGLRTDLDARVLDLDGSPMPGLYAAGRASSSLHSWGYVSGTSLGDGLFFGRVAARAALPGRH